MNDLGITERLFKKMEEEVMLRHYIEKTYRVSCWSMDAPKIAGTLLIDDYCQRTFTGDEEEYYRYRREVKEKRFPPFQGKIKQLLNV